MKWLLPALVLLTTPADTDEAAAQAKEHFEQKRFLQAATRFEAFAASEPALAAAARFNAAQAWFMADSVVLAQGMYQQVNERVGPRARSAARNNLGVHAERLRQEKQALSLYRNALLEDENNDVARFNYERLYLKLQQNPPPVLPPPPSAGSPPPPEHAGIETQGGSDFPSTTASQRTEALRLLLAREQQYLQALRKRLPSNAYHSPETPTW